MTEHYQGGHRREHKDGAPPELGAFVDDVAQDVKGWVEAQKEYTLLVVSERVGRLSGSLMLTALIALLLAGALLMCAVALGAYLGELLHSVPLGFLCAGGGYLLIALCVAVFGQRWIKDRITLAIINASRDEDPLP